DRDMNILRCSRVWRDLRGVGLEVIGMSLFDLNPAARDRWASEYEECLAGASLNAERVQFDLPGGGSAWMRVQMGPWRDTTGDIAGLLIMTHDVTEMVTALATSQRSERRLLMALELGQLYVWEFDYDRGEFATG